MNAIFIVVLLWNFQLKEFPPEKIFSYKSEAFLIRMFSIPGDQRKENLMQRTCTALQARVEGRL